MKCLTIEIPNITKFPIYLLAITKFMLFIFVVFTFLLHHFTIKSIFSNTPRIISYLNSSLRSFSIFVVLVLNIKINYKPNHFHKGLFLSNHLSYIDIIILLTQFPLRFITSCEVKESLLFGKITTLANCFFIERRRNLRNSGQTNADIRSLAKMLSKGHCVHLFPEGTTSDGSNLLPFKAPLLCSAQITKSPVNLIALKYDERDRPIVAWYGDMTFLSHFFKLCQMQEIRVELRHMSTFTILPDIQIAEIADLAHSMLKNNLHR